MTHIDVAFRRRFRPTFLSFELVFSPRVALTGLWTFALVRHASHRQGRGSRCGLLRATDLDDGCDTHGEDGAAEDGHRK